MNYSLNLKYLHPLIGNNLLQILAQIRSALPEGYEARFISGYRTPENQFELYKHGRAFKNGIWKRHGAVVTHLDGFVKKSRHNSLPATACDIGLFLNGIYQGESPFYDLVQKGTEFGLNWGGSWGRFMDKPHLEVPLIKLFKGNLERDCAWLWQKYLIMAGTYKGVHDGYFGVQSSDALLKATGMAERTISTWDKLFDRFGMLSVY